MTAPTLLVTHEDVATRESICKGASTLAGEGHLRLRVAGVPSSWLIPSVLELVQEKSQVTVLLQHSECSESAHGLIDAVHAAHPRLQVCLLGACARPEAALEVFPAPLSVTALKRLVQASVEGPTSAAQPGAREP